MAFAIVLALICIILALLYYYLARNLTFWTKRGVPSLTAPTLRGGLEGTLSLLVYPKEIYTFAPDAPYIGITTLTDPVMSVRDPDLIKRILIKDFAYFQDSGFVFNEKWNPLSAHIFLLEGKRWKGLRENMSPAFATGKIRAMFPIMQERSVKLIDVLKEKCSNGNTAINIKDFVSRSNTDTILSCAFGLQGKALSDPDDAGYSMVRHFFETSKSSMFINKMFYAFPWLAYIIPPDKQARKNIDMFLKMFKAAIKQRTETGVKRNDILDTFLEIMRKGQLKVYKSSEDTSMIKVKDETFEITDNLMAAQAWSFFIAGYETLAGNVSFAFYELAHHPEILKTLQNEVDDTIKKRGGFTYEAMDEMPYLRMVLSETLRLHTPSNTLKRRVAINYTMPDGVIIPKGVRVALHVRAMHSDPRYYPNPRKFDPERFTPEAIAGRHKYVYMPFGEGPRKCLAARFAFVQMTVNMVSILQNFEISPTPGVPYSPELSSDDVTVILTPRHHS